MEAKERKAALRAAMRTLTERAVRAREQERLQLQARRRSAPAPPPQLVTEIECQREIVRYIV